MTPAMRLGLCVERPRRRKIPRGATPLDYMAMMRYDTMSETREARERSLECCFVRVLWATAPGDPEIPLMTAASYGDAEVAKVLVEAGASLTATALPEAGGVPTEQRCVTPSCSG